MLAKGGKGKGKKKKGSTQQSGNVVNPDIDYWNYGEKGDTHTPCPKKSKKKQTWSKGKGQEAHATQAQEDYGFSSSTVSEALDRTLEEGTLSQITIYDSGASMHMSPNKKMFSEFRTIAPKGVKAVDKTIFMVTGVGCMKIDMPNGRDTTTVTLNHMLYCPDLGYTPVSLAKCDTAGFTVILKDKSYYIMDAKGLQIGQIPQYQGLYQVDDSMSAHIGAYMGVRVHTVDKLHWKMGHISQTVIKWLIEQKIVLGLKLDIKSEPSFCPTCAKAKPTHKPVPKERVEYVSQALGDEIHSDVWGPATLQS